MSPFVFGKHPAFGDFVTYGGSRALAQGLGDWLEALLPKMKKALGTQWETTWDMAPPLRFWLGPSVLGQPLQGVFLTSKDRVGRRFPLIVGVTDVALVPPVDARHDETIYDEIWAHMLSQKAQEAQALQGAADLLEGFSPKAGATLAWQEGHDATLWGMRQDGDLTRLFSDARAADAEQAQWGRSHWWQVDTPQRQAGWLALEGLPGEDALHWLLADRWKETPSIDDDTQAQPEGEGVS